MRKTMLMCVLAACACAAVGGTAERFSHGSLTEKDRLGAALFDLPSALPPKSYALLVFDL